MNDTNSNNTQYRFSLELDSNGGLVAKVQYGQLELRYSKPMEELRQMFGPVIEEQIRQQEQSQQPVTIVPVQSQY